MGFRVLRDLVRGFFPSIKRQALNFFPGEGAIEEGDLVYASFPVGPVVVAPADEEVFRASLTPSDGQLFLRSTQVLYCIGKRK